MKLYRGALALCLIFIVAFSVASIIQRQKEADAYVQNIGSAITHRQSAQVLYLLRDCQSPSPNSNFMLFGTASLAPAVAEKTPLPDNSTRTEIYTLIAENPGVQFRAICGGLGLSIGVVQFHLAQLQKNGLITSFRKGRYKRFFAAASNFSRRKMELIAALRITTVRNILKALLEGKQVSHRSLALQVRISAQGLPWQMNRLLETGLIEEKRSGLNVTYSLKQNCAVMVAETIALVETG